MMRWGLSARLLVVQKERLHAADHDLRVAPVVTAFLVNDGLCIVGEVSREGFRGMILDEEQYAGLGANVRRYRKLKGMTQEQLALEVGVERS
jgi:hypothetical protein